MPGYSRPTPTCVASLSRSRQIIARIRGASSTSRTCRRLGLVFGAWRGQRHLMHVGARVAKVRRARAPRVQPDTGQSNIARHRANVLPVARRSVAVARAYRLPCSVVGSLSVCLLSVYAWADWAHLAAPMRERLETTRWTHDIHDVLRMHVDEAW